MKPGLLKVMSYFPEGTLTKTYRPDSLVDVVRVVLVDLSIMMTCADGTSACCWSVTWPVTVLVEVACDQAGVVLRLSSTPSITTGSPCRKRKPRKRENI